MCDEDAPGRHPDCECSGTTPTASSGVTKNPVPDSNGQEDENRGEFGNEAVIWICQRAGDYFPHPECPFDCDCRPVRYIRAATNQTREAVSRPSNDASSIAKRYETRSPDAGLDPVLVSLCVERAAEAIQEEHLWPKGGRTATSHGIAITAVRAVIPLLLEAGAKRERERIVEAIEGERLTDTELPLSESRLSVTGRAGDRAYNRAIDDCLASITEEGKG